MAASVCLEASEPLTKGAYVNIFDDAGVPKIRRAFAALVGCHAHGYVTQDTPAGEDCVVYFSAINIDAQGSFEAGDVYLSATVPGEITSIPPHAPGQVVQRIGVSAGAAGVITVIEPTPRVLTAAEGRPLVADEGYIRELAASESLPVELSDFTDVSVAGLALMSAETVEAQRTQLELGSAALEDVEAFATAAQGALADTAVQTGADAAVALGSGIAAFGQVLSADGAGNAAWQTIESGGGSGGAGSTITLFVEGSVAERQAVSLNDGGTVTVSKQAPISSDDHLLFTAEDAYAQVCAIALPTGDVLFAAVRVEAANNVSVIYAERRGETFIYHPAVDFDAAVAGYIPKDVGGFYHLETDKVVILLGYYNDRLRVVTGTVGDAGFVVEALHPSFPGYDASYPSLPAAIYTGRGYVVIESNMRHTAHFLDLVTGENTNTLDVSSDRGYLYYVPAEDVFISNVEANPWPDKVGYSLIAKIGDEFIRGPVLSQFPTGSCIAVYEDRVFVFPHSDGTTAGYTTYRVKNTAALNSVQAVYTGEIQTPVRSTVEVQHFAGAVATTVSSVGYIVLYTRGYICVCEVADDALTVKYERIIQHTDYDVPAYSLSTVFREGLALSSVNGIGALWSSRELNYQPPSGKPRFEYAAALLGVMVSNYDRCIGVATEERTDEQVAIALTGSTVGGYSGLQPGEFYVHDPDVPGAICLGDGAPIVGRALTDSTLQILVLPAAQTGAQLDPDPDPDPDPDSDALPQDGVLVKTFLASGAVSAGDALAIKEAGVVGRTRQGLWFSPFYSTRNPASGELAPPIPQAAVYLPGFERILVAQRGAHYVVIMSAKCREEGLVWTEYTQLSDSDGVSTDGIYRTDDPSIIWVVLTRGHYSSSTGTEWYNSVVPVSVSSTVEFLPSVSLVSGDALPRRMYARYAVYHPVAKVLVGIYHNDADELSLRAFAVHGGALTYSAEIAAGDATVGTMFSATKYVFYDADAGQILALVSADDGIYCIKYEAEVAAPGDASTATITYITRFRLLEVSGFDEFFGAEFRKGEWFYIYRQEQSDGSYKYYLNTTFYTVRKALSPPNGGVLVGDISLIMDEPGDRGVIIGCASYGGVIYNIAWLFSYTTATGTLFNDPVVSDVTYDIPSGSTPIIFDIIQERYFYFAQKSDGALDLTYRVLEDARGNFGAFIGFANEDAEDAPVSVTLPGGLTPVYERLKFYYPLNATVYIDPLTPGGLTVESNEYPAGRIVADGQILVSNEVTPSVRESRVVTDGTVDSVIALTQAQYDAVPIPNPTTLYIITDA